MSGVADRLARLHTESFAAPWTRDAFEDLLAQTGVWAVEAPDGFVLMRQVADEAEVLTLAVLPASRRRGVGAELVRRGVADAARRGALRIFLEVAESNAAARALYGRAGFVEAGQRRGYYARPDGDREDALLLALNLSGPLP